MDAAELLKDVELPDDTGEDVRLGELWQDQHVVFIWLRHYG